MIDQNQDQILAQSKLMYKDNIFEKVRLKIKSNPRLILSLFLGSKQKGDEIYIDSSHNSWSYNINKHVIKDFRDNSKGSIIDAYSKFYGMKNILDSAQEMAHKLNIKNEDSAMKGNYNESSHYNHSKVQHARNMWNKSSKIKYEAPLRYLRDVRNIQEGILTAQYSLRCSLDTYHIHTKSRHPAIICGLFNDAGKIECVQRIYLDRYGNKLFDNTNKLAKNKKCLGKLKGNYVKLGSTWDKHKRIIICEGVESGLSLLQDSKSSGHDWEVWCALSASNMINLAGRMGEPENVVVVDIRPDVDLNTVGVEAAQMLAKRLSAKGHTVKITLPTLKKDIDAA